jgi:hypothetical protein
MFLGLTMLFLPGSGLVPVVPARRRALVLFGGITALCIALLLKLQHLSMPPQALLGFASLALVGSAATVLGLPRELLSKQNLLRGTLFVAIVAAHLVWRKSYYGAWVPNTFTAKTGDAHQQIVGGLEYLKRYATHEGMVFALVAFGVGAAIGMKKRRMLGFAAAAVCVTTYVAMVGGDWMPMHRFATSLQPFLYLLVAYGLRELIEERRPALNWGFALLAVSVVGYRAGRLEEDRRKILFDEKGFWDRAAGGVARCYSELERVHGRDAVAGEIALGDIGQVGYETRMPIVDLLGLVDPVIARLPGGYTHKTGPGFRDYFFERRPRYFVLISAQNDCVHPSVTGSVALFRDGRFRSSYSVSGRVLLNGGFSWCLYERNESVDVNRPVMVIDGERATEMPRAIFGAASLPTTLGEPRPEPSRTP